MTRDEFQRYLQLYGADPGHWPDMARTAAQDAMQEHADLVQLEREFEAKARLRLSLPDDAGFAERIIAIAREPNPALGWKARLQLLRQEFAQALPLPAYSFAAIALVGFALGFYTQPGNQAQTLTLNTFLYDLKDII